MDSPLHNTIKTQRITLLHPYLRHRSNHINSNLYHYGGLGQRQLLGNNPVKYVDPDGNDIEDVDSELVMSSANEHSKLGNEESNDYINKSGCVLTAYTRIANSLGRKKYTLEEANQIAIQKGLYTNGNELTSENGANLVNALLNGTGKSITFAGSIMDMANAFNIKVNDTSGVRSQIMNDVRQNNVLRIDYFRID